MSRPTKRPGGTLGIPDMPLTFHLHTVLAWALSATTGMASADAIPWVVKLCDAVLPPLVAWPVFVLVRRWAAPRQQGDAVPLTAAALACLAAPWFGMIGDFQKNSLALVWLATLAVTLHGWLMTPPRRNGLAMLACLLLLGLTHIGVLGAAIVLMAAVLLAQFLRRGSFGWRERLPWLASGAVLLGLAAALVLWRFDPARIHRLGTALTNPAKFSGDGMQMPMPPGGGPGALLRWVPALAFLGLIGPGLALAWRRRTTLPPADFALIFGASLTVAALTGPWFSMDKAMRFYLIALGPAICVAAFAGLHVATPWRRHWMLGVVLLLGLGPTTAMVLRGGSAIFDDPTMRELQGLTKHVEQPERTLVVTQHGAEWWSAWFLHARIAQASALKPTDWQRYDRVLFLEVKSGMRMPPIGGLMGLPGMGPPRGQGPPGFGPPRGGPQGPPPGFGPGGPRGWAAAHDGGTHSAGGRNSP